MCGQRLRFPQRLRSSSVVKGTVREMKKAAVILLALGIVGQAEAYGRDFLARFEGGIGVITVANAAGPANADGTFPNVKLNIVRGVSRSPA